MYWIETIDEAHTITRGCVFSASGLDAIGFQWRYETAYWGVLLTRRACIFYGALRAVFSASALDTIGPQRRYEVAHWTISLTRRP